MTNKELKLVCPQCRTIIGHLVKDRFSFQEECPNCSNHYAKIDNVPNMRGQLEMNENLNLLEESKSLPKQNSNNLEIPFVQEALKSNELVLELGAGVDICNNSNLIKTDAYLYSTDLHCLADAHSLPFEDNTFGFVYSLAVFEHLHSPWVAAEEIYRVLKPGGKAFTLTAFMQHMHGYPHHYFNMTTSGLERIFKSFEVLNCEASKHSNITEIAYILCDLNNVLNQRLKEHPTCKNQLLKFNDSVNKLCENIVPLNECLVTSLDTSCKEFTKIAPAIEIVAKKPH